MKTPAVCELGSNLDSSFNEENGKSSFTVHENKNPEEICSLLSGALNIFHSSSEISRVKLCMRIFREIPFP